MKTKYNSIVRTAIHALLVLELLATPLAITQAATNANNGNSNQANGNQNGNANGNHNANANANANTTTTPKPPGAGETSIGQYLCVPEGQYKTDLYTCINKLYRFSLAAGFFIAVLFIVVAGYLYMTGGEKGVTSAKSIISSTIVAIVIMLTSYILLRQINPDLVKFKPIQPLDIHPENLNTPVKPGDLPTLGNDAGSGSGGGPRGSGFNAHADQSCSASNNTCVKFDAAGIVSCGASPCLGQKALVDKLNQAGRTLQQNGGPKIQTTSASPASGGHESDCHFTGACVDIGFDTSSIAGVTKACTALKQAGVLILNEYVVDEWKNDPNYNAFVQACGQPSKSTNWSGPHLHVGIQ